MQGNNFCRKGKSTANPLYGSDKNAHQIDYMHTSSNHYVHASGKNYNAYSFDYVNPSQRNNSYVSRKKSYPARPKPNVSQPPAKMWVVKKT